MSKITQYTEQTIINIFKRAYYKIIKDRLEEQRKFIQIVTGPRQVGKTTVVKHMLSEYSELRNSGYLVIKGEEPYPITEHYDEACIIVVQCGLENESTTDGIKQKEKNFYVKSQEGKEIRKNAKKNRSNRQRKKQPKYHYHIYNNDNYLPDEKGIETDIENIKNIKKEDLEKIIKHNRNVERTNSPDNNPPSHVHFSRVAKELNVGIPTMTDFLFRKGHTVSPNPNTSLNDDEYGLLIEEYGQK